MNYWQSLAQRERVMIILGVVAIVAILLWALVWDPFSKRLNVMRVEVPAKQSSLRWMESHVPLAQNLQASQQTNASAPVDSTPLVTVIEQTAASVNIRNVIRRIEPDGEQSVKVWLSEAYFDPWIQWAEVLKQRGVEVAAATVARGPNNTVSIRATFERP